MCWYVPLVLSGLSTVAQMRANEEATNAAVAEANYNRAESLRGANTAAVQAQNAYERGEAERESHQRSFAKEQGQRAAAAGASGFAMNSGSNLDTLADAAGQNAINANAIRSNTAAQVRGYAEQRHKALANANQYQASAISAKNAGRTRRGNILLNAAGSAASILEKRPKSKGGEPYLE